jgi:glycosyltransferase involved in cell wall biosynthesis
LVNGLALVRSRHLAYGASLLPASSTTLSSLSVRTQASPITVIHVLPFKLAFSNGVQSAAWNLAIAQARLGLDVVILSLGRKPTHSEVECLSKAGIRLDGLSKQELFSPSIIRCFLATWFSGACNRVVHFHSVFTLQQSLLGFYLRTSAIPYCITFAGNFLPKELQRRYLKKYLYRRLLEDSFAKRASLLIAVSTQESGILKRMFPSNKIVYLPNTLLPPPLIHRSKTKALPQRGSQPIGCFLGKKDLYHKGLDRLITISNAARSPVDAYLLESNQQANNQQFQDYLSQHNTNHFRVAEAVYGEQKFHVLSRHDYYIHLARWEVFGVAIIEAMSVGLPVILSRECDLSHFVDEERLGLVIDCDSPNAIAHIKAYISDPLRMKEDGSRAATWARRFTDPHRLGMKSRALYRRMLERT